MEGHRSKDEEVSLGGPPRSGPGGPSSWFGQALQAVVLLGAGVAIGAVLFGSDSNQGPSIANPPLSAQGGGSDDSSPGSSPDSEPAARNECEEKGLTRETGGGEGSCDQNGTEIIIVDKGSLLKLDEVNVKLTKIEKNKVVSRSYLGTERAEGSFATLTLEVTNKLKVPQYFDDLQEQVFLRVNGALYSQDFDVQNGLIENSFVSIQEEIQPQGTQTGTVTFDLPARVAPELEVNGNLEILNFSDAGSNQPLQVGVIRTYE